MRTAIILFLTLLVPKGIIAQSCKTLELNEIYTLAAKRDVNCEIRKDSNQNIVHIGLPIFKEDAKNVFPKQILDFIERYNLYLKLLSPKERNVIISDKNLKVKPDDFFKVDSLCNFMLNFDGNDYSAVWQKNDLTVCRFGFENSFPLISGMNIKESQKFFQEEVLNYHNSCSEFTSFIGIGNTIDDGKYLIVKGEKYIIDGMKSDLYLSKKDTTALNSTDYPIQTVSNIFAGIIDNSYTLKITHNLYNYKKNVYEINLQNFVNYCLSNNCKPFVGVESFKDGILKLTVIYRNIDLGYNHMLYVEFPVEILQQGIGVVPASLNTFIPTHNLKNLYNETKQ